MSKPWNLNENARRNQLVTLIEQQEQELNDFVNDKSVSIRNDKGVFLSFDMVSFGFVLNPRITSHGSHFGTWSHFHLDDAVTSVKMNAFLKKMLGHICV